MYKYEKKILFSDIDLNSHMSVDALLDAMQDCVNINSESIGKGIEYMHRTKRAWFAISWNIEVKRLPEMFEDVIVKTWPYDFSTSMGYRNVILTDSQGEDIVCADSIWTLMDMESKRPTRIEPADVEGYDLEERYPMESLGRKILLPEHFEPAETIRVRKSDIDFNGHMTNGRYIQLANEYLPFDGVIRRIRVEYKNQSRYGECISAALAKEKLSDGHMRYVVRFTGEDKTLKAAVEFIEKGRE